MRKSRERSRSARGCLEGLGPRQFFPCTHERSTTHPRASKNCVRRSGKSWRSRRLRSGLRSWLLRFAPRLPCRSSSGASLLGARGVRALWRRWDLLDRLAGDRDAYTIAEVRAYASREATMEKRHYFAAVIRGALAHPHPAVQARTSSVAEELAALVCELDDSSLGLDPACAVACAQLVSPAQSLLFNSALPPEELRSRVRQIRSGFTALDREG